jgi:hypothetical protein
MDKSSRVRERRGKTEMLKAETGGRKPEARRQRTEAGEKS